VVGESHCFWKGSDAGEFLGTKNIPTTQKTKRGKDENLNSKLTGAQSHGHLGAGGLPWCFSEVEEVAHCWGVLTMGGRCGKMENGNKGMVAVLNRKAVRVKRRGNGGNCRRRS
jgi:hypothetical protein